MAEVKDKVITAESLKAKHDYDESTYLKKSGALTTLGITATAAELNKLDGCTATVTELNYVDGVTSNIQTQLNTKSDNDHRHYPIPISVTGEDLDNYTDAGFYTFAQAYTPTNAPSGNTNGWLLVIPWTQNSATVKQIWFRHGSINNNDFETYVRTKIGSYGWSGWSKYYTTDNPPTPEEVGAIAITDNIEPSNENGNCVIGWGNYDSGSGDTNIYGENVHIYALNADGSTPSGAVFVARNSNNHTLINNAAHLDTETISDTYIYGRAVHIDTNDTNFIVDSIQLAHTDTSTISSYSSGWTYYGTASANAPTVRRYGKVVSLSGALTNTSAVTLNTTHVKVFTIPSGYRPSQDVLVLCQGSGANEFLLQIKTSGEVYIGRYGTSSFASVSADSWFPFHATWVME